MLISTTVTDDFEELRWKLLDFNESKLGSITYTPLLLQSHNSSGELVAGLGAKIYYQWLFVELLWVAEESRGQGIGSLLLTTAEEQAKARGCRQSWLDTFSFQAHAFYRKHGYIVFGELEDYPPGHRRYFLRKTID